MIDFKQKRSMGRYGCEVIVTGIDRKGEETGLYTRETFFQISQQVYAAANGLSYVAERPNNLKN